MQSNNANNIIAAGATTYVPAGIAPFAQLQTESLVQRTMFTAGTWSDAWMRVITNDRTGNSTLKSRKNAGAGNQVLTIGAAATGEFHDNSNTDTIASGDEINWEFVMSSGGTILAAQVVSSLYTPSSGVLSAWLNNSGQTVALNGVTRFYAFTGPTGTDNPSQQTESESQYSARVAGTWSGLFINVSLNAKGGNSVFRSRVNGANGNQIITIGSGVTGLLQDTTNSDSIVSGDEINYALAYFADGNNFRQRLMGSEFTAGVNVNAGAADVAETQALNLTYYFGGGTLDIQGGARSTTESNMRTQLNAAVVLTFLSVYVRANTITGNTSFTVRKNGAAGNNTFNVGSGATGYFEDATNSDSFTATDEFTYQVVTPNGGTSILFNNMAVVMTAPAAGRTTKNTRGFPLGMEIGMNWRGEV